MEESQKRKERLKAMQIGAAQAERACIQNASNSPVQLLNPLIQPTLSQATDDSSSFSKFDYYTDPLSAFHGNKKKYRNTSHSFSSNLPTPVHSNISDDRSPSHFTGPREPLMSPIHATSNQFEANHSPNLAPYTVQSHIFQNSPWQSPVGTRILYSSERPIADAASWNRATGSSGNMVSYNESPGFLTSSGRQVSSPGTYPGRRGNFHAGQGSSPRSYSERGKYGEFSVRGNISTYSGSSPGAYSGRGRSGNFSGRATINTYSGRGNGSGNSPGSYPRWSGRRQKCFQENTSTACESPHIFYSKAMVEDPWNELEPVICDILVPLDGLHARVSSDSWLPKSIAPKKTEVDETGIGKKSELSLAAYLAQSFEDAVDDAVVNT